MTALFARAPRARRVQATLTDPGRIGAALDGTAVPQPILDWLGRLHALYGVPFGYLLPSEEMLPPESIRFFRLDNAWMAALLDGAFSLGRDLTQEESSNHTATIDRVVIGPLVRLARAAAPVHRLPAHVRTARLRGAAANRSLRLTAAAGVTAGAQAPQPTWNGFLLRSRVVSDWPGLGVNVYPPGHTPDDPDPAPLEVKRLDRLGEDTDTLLCLVVGDASRIDLHEAPELLHYGLDDYDAPRDGGPVTATKRVHAFDRDATGTVTFRTRDGQPVLLDVDLGPSLRRPDAEGPPSRVIDLAAAAAAIGAKDHPDDPVALDSAQLGFAMTSGVGMVSFVRRPTPEADS